jgi:hypothetical protein
MFTREVNRYMQKTFSDGSHSKKIGGFWKLDVNLVSLMQKRDKAGHTS